MKALVIGLGSIGSRHAKNLLDLGVEVIAIEPSKQMRSMHSLDVQYADSIEEADANFAVVCSPTHLHLPHAIGAAKEGMHVLIENRLPTPPKVFLN